MDDIRSQGLKPDVPAADVAISATIASFAANLTYDRLPAQLIEFLKDHIIDTVGVSIAATRFDFARSTLKSLAELAENGRCSVVGMSDKLPLKDAVLMNGVLAHGLDYDDTHPGGPVHPSSSVFPCVLGLAEVIRCSGQDLLLAYALGVEMATRIGLAANGTMHKTGFHTTGVVGHLACAVAAGKILGLSAVQLASAQGIAGSTAAAIAEHRFDGAWNKRIHSGWAAAGGVTAASLARGGFVGTGRVYEGHDGVFRTHAGSNHADVRYGPLTAGLGQEWRALEVAVKPYPICHILHACVDSALLLRNQLDIREIAKVHVLLHPDTYHYVCENPEVRRRPTSDYMAKFSAYYVVAAALVRGRCGYAELENDAISNREILDLAQKVEYKADPNSRFPEYFSGGVEIVLRNGQHFSHHEPVNRGAGDRTLTREDIANKFLENAEYGLSRGKAEAKLEILLQLDRLNMQQVAAAVAA